MKLRPKLDPIDPLRRYNVDLTCDYLDISRARFYQKVKAGEIRVIKDGGRTYATGTEIARLSSLP